MSSAFWFMVAAVGTAGIAFLIVVVWLADRSKERDARHRSETLEKIAESGNSAAAVEYLREAEREDAVRASKKAWVAGLVTLAAGAGLMIFLYRALPESPGYFVGLIPLLVGAALLVAAELTLKPKS